MERLFKNRLYLLALLIFINLVSHFMPFERASLGPDDYAALARFKNVETAQILPYSLNCPDRPLNYLILILQTKLVGDNVNLGLTLVFLSNTAVLLAVFFLLNELFGSNFLSFIGSMIFCLIPNKLEVYHTPIFLNMNMAFCIYILSLFLFIRYVKYRNKSCFVTSIFLYGIGIFWYEVGFFLPAIMVAYSFMYKKKTIKSTFPFIIFSIIYAVYRLTGVFGLVSSQAASRAIDISIFPVNLLDLLHHYFGRYMVRSVLYGGYKFLSIEPRWLAIIVIANILFLVTVTLSIKRQELARGNNRLLFLAAVIFVSFLAPILLNNMGGVGGRHLVLPSIGIAMSAVWLLGKIKGYWRVLFLFFVVSALIICQGNAWTQVVACRINGAVYETIKQDKEELIRADNIIINTKSFADNIPFTWIKRDFNELNTYYGAQAFEDWGLKSMLKLVLGKTEKPSYISVETPRITKEGKLEVIILKHQGNRSVAREAKYIPQEGTVIINFKSVYGDSFNNGIRMKN